MLIQFYQQRSIQMHSALYVIGNIPELGSWDPKNAIKMSQKLDAWSVEVLLSQDAEYKYIEINQNQTIWDQGSNRKIKFQQQLGYNDVVSVMSFNIRFETEQDQENKWENRKQYVSLIIQQSNCDFIGLQEVLFNQYQYITESLESYNSIGRGRGHRNWDDEGVPIFYDLTKWKVIDSQIFWLSNNPNQPASTSYGNQIPRICTWVKFRNLHQNHIINVYNCHLDHISGPSQQLSAKQIKNHMQEHSLKNEFILLMGDFNSLPVGKALDIFANEGIKLQKTFSFLQIPLATFHNWYGISVGLHIDYILIDQNTELLQYQILRQQFNGHYPSDHFPLLVNIRLKELHQN